MGISVFNGSTLKFLMVDKSVSANDFGIKAGDTCLDISKLKKYQDMGLTYYEPCYLTVLVNTKNADNVAKLIEYLEEDGVNE